MPSPVALDPPLKASQVHNACHFQRCSSQTQGSAMTTFGMKKVTLNRIVNERQPLSTDEKAVMCKVHHELKYKPNKECCTILKNDHGIKVKPNTFMKIVKTATKWQQASARTLCRFRKPDQPVLEEKLKLWCYARIDCGGTATTKVSLDW